VHFVQSAESPSGHLLFQRDGTTMAQPFDPNRLELAGEAVPLPDVLASNTNVPILSASANGAFVYQGGRPRPDSRLTWFDRQGKEIGLASDPGTYYELSLSPDGTRVAVRRADAGKGGIWTIDFVRHTSTRLTLGSDSARSVQPIWSPDGSEIVFSPGFGAPPIRKPSSGAGEGKPLRLPGTESSYALDWSRDARILLFSVSIPPNNRDIWVFPLDGGTPAPYMATPFFEAGATFSPGSPRWVAYSSDESGRNEVYVRTFPDPSRDKWLISSGGGNQPRWRRDGHELFYVSPDNKLMSVDVGGSGSTFEPGIPKPLFGAAFRRDLRGFEIAGHGWDVTPNGQRFLINIALEEATAPLTVVLNWQAALKK
jgi:hypothetical protein